MWGFCDTDRQREKYCSNHCIFQVVTQSLGLLCLKDRYSYNQFFFFFVRLLLSLDVCNADQNSASDLED